MRTMKSSRIEKLLSSKLFLIYIFATIFFPLGIYTLLSGPSKWVIELALKNAWSENTEKLMQKLVILILIIVTLLLTFAFKKYILKGSAILRNLTIAILSIIFIISIYLFSFKPDVFIKLSGGSNDNLSESTVNESGQSIEFVLGSYPDLKELRRLKAVGYVGVVSLLSELVVPAEPRLIHEETENAKEVGIPLIRIPMLPFVSENNESITKIQTLAKTGHGKYFVHCYLGRDRVNVFRKIVKDLGIKSQSLQGEFQRHIEDLPSFERGNYTKLSPEVYLIPFPTDEEFFGYIVNGQFSTLISLLNPKNPEDTTWLAKEKKMLSRYGVKFVNIPILNVNDQKGLTNLADSLAILKKPLVIHKFNSNDPLYNVIIEKLCANSKKQNK